MSSTRRATHAGSWYSADARTLSKQMKEWMDAVSEPVDTTTRAIIVPHAGYRYSGPSAAHGYKNLIPDRVKRIFILGPSHHAYLTKCGLSTLAEYETPVGNLKVDRNVTKELHALGAFEYLSVDVEEAEHSLEMHLPYVAHVMKGKDFTIVPIMVGAVNKESEATYGKLLAPYLADPDNFFVISSDFCHWGRRFDYTPYDPSAGPIYKSIEALDRRGMKIIESSDPVAFTSYLRETKNTICGRHPITVLLYAIQNCRNSPPFTIRAVHYEQSSQCTSNKDSSVSYAVLIATWTSSQPVNSSGTSTMNGNKTGSSSKRPKEDSDEEDDDEL